MDEGDRAVRLGVQRAEHADRCHGRDEQQPVDHQVPETEAAPQAVVFLIGRRGRRTNVGHAASVQNRHGRRDL